MTIDRICLNENKPQIYWTQYVKKNGKISLYDVENMENINELRKSMDLWKLELQK